MDTPTAVHALADVHETPLNRLSASAGLGLMVGLVVQVVPFQCSASGAPPPGPVPAATQAAAEGQETPTSFTSEPDTAAVGWTAQLVPSQRSASVWASVRSPTFPTAVHAVGVLHDTAEKRLLTVG